MHEEASSLGRGQRTSCDHDEVDVTAGVQLALSQRDKPRPDFTHLYGFGLADMFVICGFSVEVAKGSLGCLDFNLN